MPIKEEACWRWFRSSQIWSLSFAEPTSLLMESGSWMVRLWISIPHTVFVFLWSIYALLRFDLSFRFSGQFFTLQIKMGTSWHRTMWLTESNRWIYRTFNWLLHSGSLYLMRGRGHIFYEPWLCFQFDRSWSFWSHVNGIMLETFQITTRPRNCCIRHRFPALLNSTRQMVSSKSRIFSWSGSSHPCAHLHGDFLFSG